VPWIILLRRGHEQVPSNLQGFDRIKYATLKELKCDLMSALDEFVDRIVLGTIGNEETKLLSLPFWTQLEDWIDRITHAAQPPKAILGRIRAIQYKGQKCLSKHIVPNRGLLFGRDPECDVVIESQATSWRHFRILRGQTGKYFVEDLDSTNGTFLNGARLAPLKKTQLQLSDIIRTPGARFVIWDDRPLSFEKTAHVGGTGLLPPIPRIEIPDIPPPAYLNTWDYLMILTVLTPKEDERFTFEVQSYYPMKHILSRLVNLLDLPEGKYRFRHEGKFADDDETPFSLGLKEGTILSIIPEESEP